MEQSGGTGTSRNRWVDLSNSFDFWTNILHNDQTILYQNKIKTTKFNDKSKRKYSKLTVINL